MIEFPKDFKEFLLLLNSKKIEYLVVGGYAVGYHGYPRATGDLDVWIAINNSKNNLIKNNFIARNYYGLYLDHKDDGNTITYNNFSSNKYGGIFISGSLNQNINGNRFFNDGMIMSSFSNTHNISTNNMVNGKPLRFYRNSSNIDLKGVPVGQLIIMNCSDVFIKNVIDAFGS